MNILKKVISIFFFVALSFSCQLLHADNMWGDGISQNEACVNAKSRARSQGCVHVGGRAVLSECECDTHTPDRRWKCNVQFFCETEQRNPNLDRYPQNVQQNPKYSSEIANPTTTIHEEPESLDLYPPQFTQQNLDRADSDHFPEVTISEKVQVSEQRLEEQNVIRVEDKLLDLLPDKSRDATERIKLVLELLPDGYDFGNNKIITRAKVRILKHDIQSELKHFPKIPKKPLRLVLGDGSLECTSVHCCAGQYPNTFWVYSYRIQGAYILYRDGSKTYPRKTNYRRSLHIATGVGAGSRVNENVVSSWLEKGGGARREYVEYARKEFEQVMTNYEERILDVKANLNHLRKADELLKEVKNYKIDEDIISFTEQISKLNSLLMQ